VEFANQTFCDFLCPSEKAEALSGLMDEQLMKRILPAYADPDGVMVMIRDLLACAKPVLGKEIMLRDGKVLLLDFQPLMIDGKDTGRMWMHRDITERKKATDLLRLSEQVMRLLNSSRNLKTVIPDILGKIQEYSGCEAIGLRIREGEDFPYYETRGFPQAFVSAERTLCARDESGSFVRDGAWNPELECMCGNILRGRFDPQLPFFTPGGSFWTNSTTKLLASTTERERQARTRNRCHGEGYESVALVPLRSGDEIIGLLQLNDRRPGRFTPEMIRFFEGLCASVGIAFARLQAERDLEDRNAELIRFTYTVSHDLKSPLVTVKSFLGYLGQDLAKQDAANVAKDLGHITKAADKMGKLLDELLDLSRVGRKMNPLVEVPLQELAQEALSLVAGRIAESGAAVEVAKDPVTLFGDRQRLVEVFQNLVDNAVKFMGTQPRPRVDIGVETQGTETVFFVRDNGAGIDPRHKDRLFGLFEKLDPASEGTGMGLALAKRIVEVHGGRIWAESEGLGKGTTFRFTLAKTRIKPDKETPS
jgi:signal transduction histidine kinase